MEDLTAKSRQAKEKNRNQFLKQCSHQLHFLNMFNGIEHTSVFFKNLAGEIIFGNTHFLASVGLKSLDDLLGITDHDLFPSHMVEKYKQDDIEVITSAEPKLSIVEIFKNEQGLLQWFITHKYPLFDKKNQVIGVMGSIQEYKKMNAAFYSGAQNILATSKYIQLHFRDPISIEELSRLCNIPIRQYQRKFKQVFNVSPKEYIIRHRIYYACEALRNTTKDIAKIGIDAGFYDQSSFTRQFKKHMKTTPLKYRKQTS